MIDRALFKKLEFDLLRFTRRGFYVSSALGELEKKEYKNNDMLINLGGTKYTVTQMNNRKKAKKIREFRQSIGNLRAWAMLYKTALKKIKQGGLVNFTVETLPDEFKDYEDYSPAFWFDLAAKSKAIPI